jgi:hypothetical protein
VSTGSNPNDTESRSVSRSLLIAAPAQDLFDVVANPTMHHVIDGSGTVKGTNSRIEKLSLGDTFTTRMRMGLPYAMKNKVVEFTDGELIGWVHVAGGIWRYEFSEADGGTLVTETFDWSSASAPAALWVEKAGFPARNAMSMEKTLDRLASYAERKNLGRSADEVAEQDHAETAASDEFDGTD